MTIQSFIAIFAMASVTYLTRVTGYFILKNKKLSSKTQAVFETLPACVFIAIITPYIINKDPANIIALTFAAIGAKRLPMVITIAGTVLIAYFIRNIIN